MAGERLKSEGKANPENTKATKQTERLHLQEQTFVYRPVTEWSELLYTSIIKRKNKNVQSSEMHDKLMQGRGGGSSAANSNTG